MNESIFENFFGEKPHEQGAKRIANGALNSYIIKIKEQSRGGNDHEII
jgi:hypothetical protein